MWFVKPFFQPKIFFFAPKKINILIIIIVQVINSLSGIVFGTRQLASHFNKGARPLRDWPLRFRSNKKNWKIHWAFIIQHNWVGKEIHYQVYRFEHFQNTTFSIKNNNIDQLTDFTIITHIELIHLSYFSSYNVILPITSISPILLL